MGRFHPHGDDSHHDHLHDHDHVHDHGDHGDREVGLRDHDHGAGVGDHSGYETGSERIMVLENILGENDRSASENRRDLARHGIRAINVMSSPGAGKTTLLRRLVPELVRDVRVGIVEGDIATSIDADQLAGLGAAVALVNTAEGFGGECHLDAVMVRAGLDQLDLDDLDLVIIENVGNLVCPAEFDVGQDARLMVYSITEGEEKPLKYPVMFRAVEAVIVNKMDLLPHLDFDLDSFRSNLRQVNPNTDVFEVSAKTGDGVDAFVSWLGG